MAPRKKIHVQTAVVLTVMLRDDRPYYAYGLYQRVPWIDQTTLSTMINRMLRDGLVELVDGPQPAHGNVPRRRHFQLTDAGRETARTTAYDRLVQLARTLAELNVTAPKP